jgi:hypothetical protein
MLADADSDGGKAFERAVVDTAGVLGLDTDEAAALARAFAPAVRERVRLYQRLRDGEDIRGALARLDVDVERRMRAQASPAVAHLAFVLWRKTVDWPLPGEPWPDVAFALIEPLPH